MAKVAKRTKKTVRRWMNIYPRADGLERAVLFSTKQLANSFAVPGIIACVPIRYEVGKGLDSIELKEMRLTQRLLRTQMMSLADAVERAHNEVYVKGVHSVS